MAMGKKGKAKGNETSSMAMGDAREWDEAAYRRRLLSERRLSHRTIFRAAFAPSVSDTSKRHSFNLNLNPDHHLLLQEPLPDTVAAASSDGSIASYSLKVLFYACISVYMLLISSSLQFPISFLTLYS